MEAKEEHGDAGGCIYTLDWFLTREAAAMRFDSTQPGNIADRPNQFESDEGRGKKKARPHPPHDATEPPFYLGQ